MNEAYVASPVTAPAAAAASATFWERLGTEQPRQTRPPTEEGEDDPVLALLNSRIAACREHLGSEQPRAGQGARGAPGARGLLCLYYSAKTHFDPAVCVYRSAYVASSACAKTRFKYPVYV